MDLHVDVVSEEVIDDGQGTDDAAVNTGSAAVDMDSALVAGDAIGDQAVIVDDGVVDSEDVSSIVISEAEGTVPKSRK